MIRTHINVLKNSVDMKRGRDCKFQKAASVPFWMAISLTKYTFICISYLSSLQFFFLSSKLLSLYRINVAGVIYV